MSRDKRLNRAQEVVGSIPISSTKINDFRNNNLARPAFFCAVLSRPRGLASRRSGRAGGAFRKFTAYAALNHCGQHDELRERR